MRLIDADKIDTRERGNNSQRTMWWNIKQIIDDAPTVETRPEGEWINLMETKGYVVCPFCGKEITGGDLNFCVKCGADMRGDKK